MYMPCSAYTEVMKEDILSSGLIPDKLQAVVAALEEIVTEPCDVNEGLNRLQEISADVQVGRSLTASHR